jgi:DUF1365 family protein
LESAIYEGAVRHVRHGTVTHAFEQRLALLYLDLAELERVAAVSRWLGVERRALASFRRRDHLGDPGVPLDVAVRDLVESRLGRRPAGPIRLLAQPRVLGHLFNPLALFFCESRGSRVLEAVVAEVTNTPWLERHAYVLDLAAAPAQGGTRETRCAKQMHVSPFLDMEQEYAFRIGVPGPRLFVEIANLRAGERVFSATLALERRELTPAALRRNLLRGALAPARNVAAIHWQALRLWLRGAPFHPHPRHAASAAREQAA